MKFIFRSISYFRPEVRLIVVLFAMIGASVVLNLLVAWPMAILVDTVLSHKPQVNAFHRLFLAPFGDDRMVQILGVAVTGMVLKILADTVMLTRAMINNRIRCNGTARLRMELYRKLQDLSLSWHRTRSQGDTIYRLSYDSNGPWGILDILIGSSAASLTLTAMIVIMLYRSVPLTIFALSITPLLVVANTRFSRTIRLGAAESKRCDASLLVTLQRALGAMGIIQAFNRQRTEAKGFDGVVGQTVTASMHLAWQESLFPLAVQTIFSLGGAVIFGFGGYLVYRDQFLAPTPNGVTCGDLMVFMAYLGQLWDPLGWVIGFKTKIQTQAASCERVFNVLDERPSITEPTHPVELPLSARTLSLANVGFDYQPGAPLLRRIDATIRPGEMVAFVGPSGSGKSTILNLLPRFYDPCKGAVMLDGTDLREIKISDVRKHMAVVAQDSPLFPDTIYANLRYGKAGASEREIRAAADEAGASEFVEALPDGYGTVITESSQNLSGGQRQRLAIARALLSAAPILILDEPTSALDADHEQLILETLYRLRGKRTIILVTHRIESVSRCDQIFVLRRGTIVERGTHLQLLAKRGHYAAMLEGGLEPLQRVG